MISAVEKTNEMGEKAKHVVDEARGATKDATVRVKEAVAGKVTTPGPSGDLAHFCEATSHDKVQIRERFE